MASVDAAGDPLSTAASATSLLLWTLGPAAAAASPSRACGALLGGPLKRSKELMEQARLVLKERGDIQKLYQEDGMNVAAAVNGKNNQQGRRPGLDRKRARFSLKPPQSNPAQNVDFSQLLSIEDPDEYFSTLDQLEEADKEIKKLRGEVPTKTADHHRPVEPPKRRPGMSRRKSVYSYNFRAGVDTPDVTEAPVSQIETITESQSTQDDMAPSAPEGTKLPVPSSSSQCDIPDVSAREDSFAEKGKGALDELLSAFKNLDEAEEENLIREKLQIKEISIGKVCLPDLFNSPNDRPVSSTTKRKHLTNGHTPERSVSGIHHARISKWEKQILDKDILNDKADLSEDDESDNSPGIVTGQQSTGHGHNSVVSTGGEASTGRETPTSSTKSPDHVLETVPNVPNGVSTDESEPRSSSFGVCIDSEVATEKDTSSRHNVSLEEDDVPMDQPVIERPHYEQTISSPHHLEGDTTEVPGSVPGRNASTLHDEDDNIEHQGGVGGDGLVEGEPVHLTEIPPDAHNQSHIQDGNMEKRAVDISRELSLSKDGKQKAVQKGKNKKQSANRGKRIPGEPIHTPEIPSEDIDPQNQSHINEGNFEKPAVRISSQLSPSKDSKQKQVEDGKRKQPLRRGKRGAEEPSDPLAIPPENCDTETQPHMHDTNIEQHTVGTRALRSPNDGKGQKETQRRKKRQEFDGRKSLAAFGFSWQSGVRRSTRIRSRPLQQWRGERFLYGRIHNTMSTVIGIKLYSPSQDGKVALRVKSFVPEQYSDILAHAAKY